MALLKKANTWYAYFRDLDGRQVKRSLHTGDRAIAEIREKAMRDMIREVKFRAACQRMRPDEPQITTAFPKKQAPSPGEHQRGGIALAKMWELANTRRELSERHSAVWKRFIGSLPPGIKYADQVTPKVALNYLEQNYGLMSGKTYNNIKTTLHTIFRLCLVEAGLAESPFAPIANRRVTNVEHHRPLTEAEFIKAFKAAAEPWKTAMLIAWHTALRRESCFRLAWEHIDPNDNPPSITITPGKTARFGRAVYIPIHRQLWDWLCQLPRPESDSTPILSQWKSYIHFPGYKNDQYIAGLFKHLGISDTADGKASFHSLRVSFITRCDEAGINRIATRGVAGQVEDNITDLYSHDRKTAKQILKLPAPEL
jgi:integrase